jgi:hypothetical protein
LLQLRIPAPRGIKVVKVGTLALFQSFSGFPCSIQCWLLAH